MDRDQSHALALDYAADPAHRLVRAPSPGRRDWTPGPQSPASPAPRSHPPLTSRLNFKFPHNEATAGGFPTAERFHDVQIRVCRVPCLRRRAQALTSGPLSLCYHELCYCHSSVITPVSMCCNYLSSPLKQATWGEEPHLLSPYPQGHSMFDPLICLAKRKT